MKFHYSLITFLIFIFSYSQTIILKGEVLDANNLPLSFADVNLISKDSVIANSLTDIEGKFSILLNKGNYKLEVEKLGIPFYSRKINIIEDLDLGKLKINKIAEKEIEKVVIRGGKKILEMKTDHLSFNVENSIFSDTGDLIDLLKITPGIVIQNDKISLIGKNSLNILINDKTVSLYGDDLINYLKSLRSSDVKNIMIITNPSAKYDAEGQSGIINIQLKKVKQNYWSASLINSYTQGFYGYGNIGSSINYNKNNLTTSWAINYSNGRYRGVEKSAISYPLNKWEEKDVSKNYINSLSNRFTLDYQITTKWNMGLQYSLNYNNPKSNGLDNVNIYKNSTFSLDSQLLSNNTTNSIQRLNSINTYSIFNIDSIGKKLIINFDYFNSNKDSRFNLFSKTLNSNSILINNYVLNSENDFNVDNFSGKIDMEHPLKFLNLQYGGKISSTETNSSIRYFNTSNDLNQINKDNSNEFNYIENIQSLYFSVNKIIKKWSLQAGLRMENVQTKGNSLTLKKVNKNEYTEFFPTLYVVYNSNENNTFSLNYGRRVQRPNYNSVNPFRYYSSPYSFSEGNPFLKPSFSHNVELAYIYKNYLQTIIQLGIINNSFAQVTYLDAENYIQEVRIENFYDTYSIGIGQVFSYTKLSWLQNYTVLGGFYNYSKSKIYPITPKTTEGFGGFIQTNNTFIINKEKNISSGFVLSYYSPNKGGELTYNKSKTQLDIFLRMMFLDKRLMVSLQANNLLKSPAFNNENIRNGIHANYKGFYDTQYFRISLSYNLGNSTIKSNNIEVSNEEEQGRIN